MTSVEPPAPPIGDPLGAVRVYRLLLPLSVLQAADLYSPPAATARVRAGQLVSGCVPGGNETGRRPCFLELEGGLGWLPLELPGGVEAVKEVHVEEVWPPEVWEVANGGTDLVIRSQPDWQEPSFKGPAEAAGRFVADGAMCLVAAKVTISSVALRCWPNQQDLCRLPGSETAVHPGDIVLADAVVSSSTGAEPEAPPPGSRIKVELGASGEDWLLLLDGTPQQPQQRVDYCLTCDGLRRQLENCIAKGRRVDDVALSADSLCCYQWWGGVSGALGRQLKEGGHEFVRFGATRYGGDPCYAVVATGGGFYTEGLPGDLLDEMHKRAAAKLFLFKSDAGGYYLATRARSMWSTANPWLRKELKKATSVHWVSVSASGDWIIISDQRFVASVDVAPALTRQLAQFYSAARAEGAAAAAAYDAAMARFQPWLASYVGMKAAAQNAALTLTVNGAARGNPGPAAIGAVFALAGTGEVLLELAETIGDATNNVAEYRAIIAGLAVAVQCRPQRIRHLTVKSDSELLVKQMNGEYQVKDPRLQDLHQQAHSLAGRLSQGKLLIRHVSRKFTAHPNALANKELDRAAAEGARPSKRPRMTWHLAAASQA
eukprot:jgi/Tetstr1/422737/TSEL_013534.t1